ncbi:hypothetical protein OCK74_16365 [Chitinophagaceae bacterium LB-8]|uniref:Porin n=1 Tax=Paraflavisolibacter caeni TaxID=2982496 RepID=A0A9X2XP87_9BACT|nr:hypothetical protein [Paraflavisolibacter caeni]MCU7550693.1 hypothetical protein [Paraflavisolibacter caeni]
MKKFTIASTIKLALMTACALPFVVNAQTENIDETPDREIYLRPSYWRPYDKRGINVFETNKMADTIPYSGPRVRFGAGFTQQFQGINHENPDADNNGGTSVSTAGANKLYPITAGFMTAMANLFTDFQLGDGIRLNLTTYLSTRHHNETWVKGGYIQFDKLPFKGEFWTNLMKITTIKVGHMEINYGDQHFRRSDGGQTLYNPFMDNYIMDAFTTEIGGEVYVQKNGWLAMGGITNGMLKGNVDTVIATSADENTDKNPSFFGKLAYDKQVSPDLRFRLSGSIYYNSSSPASGLTLYGGDRAGSNYQNVMEKWVTNAGTPQATQQASTSIAFSGRLNPAFSKKVQSIMVNGFLKFKGFEFFGTYENAEGRTKNEKTERDADQYALEGLYRFGKAESIYLGARYNSVDAELSGITTKINVNRLAFAGGWFVTRNVLLKAEYVVQNYEDFPSSDYRAGGQFDGYVIEAVVGF